jgi:hypothetical protein
VLKKRKQPLLLMAGCLVMVGTFLFLHFNDFFQVRQIPPANDMKGSERGLVHQSEKLARLRWSTEHPKSTSQLTVELSSHAASFSNASILDSGVTEDPIILPPLLEEVRLCNLHQWCPDKTMCARNPQTGELGCYGSTCRSVTDFESCSPVDTCVALKGGVFRCAPAGFVGKNGACLNDQFVNVSQRCASGLLCVAGKCSALCGDKNECPAGTDCQTTNSGSFCVTSKWLCKVDGDCAPDRTCLATPLGVSVCATAAAVGEKPGCLPGRCAADEVCEGELVGSQFFGRCFKQCRGTSKCEGGLACIPNSHPNKPGTCHPLCQMGGLLCPFGDDCVYDFEKNTGFCTVSSPYDLSRNVSHEYPQIFSGRPDSLPSKK